jgi:hypothetical protein
MSKICPQRIIKEAIRLLEQFYEEYSHNDELSEQIDNNVTELENLEKALYRDGIINIEEFHANACAEQSVLRKQPQGVIILHKFEGKYIFSSPLNPYQTKEVLKDILSRMGGV